MKLWGALVNFFRDLTGYRGKAKSEEVEYTPSVDNRRPFTEEEKKELDKKIPKIKF